MTTEDVHIIEFSIFRVGGFGFGHSKGGQRVFNLGADRYSAEVVGFGGIPVFGLALGDPPTPCGLRRVKRRDGDSNPGYAFGVYTLSRRAP